jgi:glycosyltransferase involved in cell wall biosynthesis
MHILICNERFLFRFGHDRSLILLGRGLALRGHKIIVMANAMDNAVIDSFAASRIQVPTFQDADYFYSNEKVAQWLEAKWDGLFQPPATPDLIIAGGWPFYAALPFLSRKAKVICLDCGAVPLDGLTGGPLHIQNKLRSLRRDYLRHASRIISNSRFTAETQSTVDSEGLVPVEPILLGADHMEMGTWNGLHSYEAGTLSNLVERLKQAGHKIILNLGRWEQENYKNSLGSFRVLQRILRQCPQSALLVLASEAELDLPAELKDKVFPIGFPDDQALSELMQRADLGLSVSLWEGFNLPLAEMQHLEKPVLAFNLGAHPEVVVHPWYLCSDEAEMAAKAVQLLSGKKARTTEDDEAYRRFHEYFTWERFLIDWEKSICRVLAEDMLLLVHINNSTQDPANSGVIRVTRRSSRSLQQYLHPIFVVWNDALSQYVLPTEQEYRQLGQFNGPVRLSQSLISPDAEHPLPAAHVLSGRQQKCRWLLIPEIVDAQRFQAIHRFARQQKLRVASIFYDAIPVIRPDLCNEEINRNHARYMTEMARCDAVMPISHFSAAALADYWTNETTEKTFIHAIQLPGEFAGGPRRTDAVPALPPHIQMLCVSTLESRKNHRRLIEACLLMKAAHPELNWSLTLIGNRYAGQPEIPEYIEQTALEHPQIRWLGIVDDERLGMHYREATFTVYPSIIEGFGMPILESIWHGIPCLCYQEGVMAELAKDGGCLTTDVLSVERLAESIYRLATDADLYRELCQQARQRRMRVWDDYVRELLLTLRDRVCSLPADSRNADSDLELHDILFPHCVAEDWAMGSPERLALTALLARHSPRCSIELSVGYSNSLILLSQFSGLVFSVALNEEVPFRFSRLLNVIFLHGPADQILPILSAEMDRAGVPINFIHFTGEFAPANLQRSLECILSLVPRTPLLLVVQNSYPAEFRQALLAVDWQQNPYIDGVELDFVPGRRREPVGEMDGRIDGGLALIYLRAKCRTRALAIQQSADAERGAAENLNNSYEK